MNHTGEKETFVDDLDAEIGEDDVDTSIKNGENGQDGASKTRSRNAAVAQKRVDKKILSINDSDDTKSDDN
jgi:hypothetical protein